jgi:hypothetical protein
MPHRCGRMRVVIPSSRLASLELRPVGEKQQSLWPSPIFRGRVPQEWGSIYGQGLKEVRRDGRLGVCSIQRWQTCRRGGAQNLLTLPPACQSSRLCLHPLRTLIPRAVTLRVYRYLLFRNPCRGESGMEFYVMRCSSSLLFWICRALVLVITGLALIAVVRHTSMFSNFFTVNAAEVAFHPECRRAITRNLCRLWSRRAFCISRAFCA